MIQKKQLKYGAASGAATAAVGGTALALGKHGLSMKKLAKSKYLPFAIGGTIIIGLLGSLMGIKRKKKNIEELIKNEKDSAKKLKLKKELENLSKSEIEEIKNYKKEQAKAKILAKIKAEKLSPADIEKEIIKGVQKEKQIQDIKAKIAKI